MAGQPARVAAGLRGGVGPLVAFGTGAIALSYELLWYRAYSIALMARPQAFGVVLGGYLLGLAGGAWLGARWCRTSRGDADLRRRLVLALLAASLSGFVLVPAFARYVTVSHSWAGALLLVACAALWSGAVLPLVVHLSPSAEEKPGRATARVYFANIAGSTAGIVLTGFVLMDVLPMASLAAVLGVVGFVIAGAVSVSGEFRTPWRRAVIGLCLAGISVLAHIQGVPERLYAGTMERLFFRTEVGASPAFVRTIENRAGLVAVTADGRLYGGGVYDGVYNVDLRQRRRNQIHRAFAVTLFHPSPKRILMIGLGTGSWATVVADDPAVEALEVVELNPAYVDLLADHPEVARLRNHPKVRFTIDDGRRWLQRHPEERFDVIVANTVYHWRANASSLLSVEFQQLVRRHLNPGGVYYFNSTSEARVQKTGAAVFPQAWRLAHLVAVSSAPLSLNMDAWRDSLFRRHVNGRAVLDAASQHDREFADELIREMEQELETRDSILARTMDVDVITDDNMGTEWTLPARYRLF